MTVYQNNWDTTQYTKIDKELPFYEKLLYLVPSFISLDISKRGTGITVWRNGVLTIQDFAIETEDPLDTRRAFRKKMLDIYQQGVDYTFIENTIGSVNYKTAQILHQLNAIVDDLQDMGYIQAGTIYRDGNTEWKSWLKDAARYKKKVRGEVHSKSVTVECLRNLGYTGTFNTDNESDSLGIALGVLYHRFYKINNQEETTKPKKLRDDITKNYEVKQFATLEELIQYTKPYTNFHEIDMMTQTTPFTRVFKQTVQAVGDEKIFIVRIPTTKLGTLIIQYGLDVHIEISYLFIIQKGRRKHHKHT